MMPILLSSTTYIKSDHSATLSNQSYCLQPHIIKSDHSATLIDNIYLNSIEQTISGNLICDLLIGLSTNISKYHVYRKDFSNFRNNGLLADVQLIDWDEVLPVEPDVNLFF